MGVLNDTISKIAGRFSPIGGVSEGETGKFVLDPVQVTKFNPEGAFKSEDIPRGVFKTDKKEYDITLFSVSSQMLLKDATKADEAKKVVSTKAMYVSDLFESIHDFVKHPDVKEGETAPDVADLEFTVVAKIPMVDADGNQVYPPNQYAGADEYYDKLAEIRASGVDGQDRTREYRNARKALYASDKVPNLDNSTALHYPILVINN